MRHRSGRTLPAVSPYPSGPRWRPGSVVCYDRVVRDRLESRSRPRPLPQTKVFDVFSLLGVLGIVVVMFVGVALTARLILGK